MMNLRPKYAKWHNLAKMAINTDAVVIFKAFIFFEYTSETDKLH